MHAQKDKIKAALIREDQLRLGPAAQLAYSNAKTLEDIRKVTEDIQRQALEQVGISPEYWLSLDTLRRARFFFKDDPEMNQLTGLRLPACCVIELTKWQCISATTRAAQATFTATRALLTSPSTGSTAARSICARCMQS